MEKKQVCVVPASFLHGNCNIMIYVGSTEKIIEVFGSGAVWVYSCNLT